jgi:hypothetical protein
MFRKLRVGTGVGAKLVIKSSDTSLRAYGMDKADDAGLAPAIAEVLVGTDSTEMAEDKTVGTFDT